MGNFTNALQAALKSVHLFEELKNEERVAWLYITLANIYRDFGDYETALGYALKSIKIYNKLYVSARVPLAAAGSIYELQNKLDSGFAYVQRAKQLDFEYNESKWSYLNVLMGNLFRKSHQYDSSLIYYRSALPVAMVNKKDAIDTYIGIAKLYRETGRIDSSIFYANEAQRKFSSASYQKGSLEVYEILAEGIQTKK